MIEQNIMEEKWDCLIVLDACRYDFFKRIHGEFFDNCSLEERRSKGTHTLEWVKKNFPGYYDDIIYLSTNPYINSKDIKFEDWKASDHFFEVKDLWLTHWDDEKGTVHPKDVTNSALALIDEYPEKRYIVHYIQPHRPYLSYENDVMEWDANRNKIIETDIDSATQDLYKEKNIMERTKQKFGRVWKGNLVIWRIRNLLGLEPRNFWEELWRDVKSEGIKRLYEENLRLALASTKELVEHVKGEIIITSDHGEGLGERSVWGHPPKRDDLVLKKVPWLIIKK